MANHPEITFHELASQFPLNIQGKLGTFATIEDANKIYTNTGHKRHYIKPEEQLKLLDCKIAVSNQWAGGNKDKGKFNNIDDFINNARELGYKIELVNS